jgi:hypothetical protein
MGQFADGASADIGDSASKNDYDNHSMMDGSIEKIEQPGGGPMPP